MALCIGIYGFKQVNGFCSQHQFVAIICERNGDLLVLTHIDTTTNQRWLINEEEIVNEFLATH